MEKLANEVAVLLREGYSFYEACREVGVHPTEYSEIGKILGKRKRTQKRRFFIKKTITVFSKEKISTKTIEKVSSIECTAGFKCNKCIPNCLFRKK